MEDLKEYAKISIERYNELISKEEELSRKTIIIDSSFFGCKIYNSNNEAVKELTKDLHISKMEISTLKRKIDSNNISMIEKAKKAKYSVVVYVFIIAISALLSLGIHKLFN